mgnify:CR=1 FL=1
MRSAHFNRILAMLLALLMLFTSAPVVQPFSSAAQVMKTFDVKVRQG